VAKRPFPVSTKPGRKTKKPHSRRIGYKISVISTADEILWGSIGLLLTIGGTFIEASITNLPWHWTEAGIQSQSLGVTYQIGGVLLSGCLGGKNAGLMSQFAYLFLGLTFFPIFTQGGGLEYIQQPTFGYILGFLPGAWFCGWLAFKLKRKLEFFAFSSLSGLVIIHLCGIVYLLGLSWFKETINWGEAISQYSLAPLPGQLAIVCAVAVISFVLRHLLFY